MPSPEDLKGKILIKNKKLPSFCKDDTFEDEDDSESEEDEQDEQETNAKENDRRKKLCTVSTWNFYLYVHGIFMKKCFIAENFTKVIRLCQLRWGNQVS